MNAASLESFINAAQSTRAATFARYIKLDGALTKAVFSPPRLVLSLDESTVNVPRYSSILHVLKCDVPHITTPAAWKDVEIRLPEGTSWRRYEIIGEAVDVEPGGEWKLNLSSL